MKDIADLLAEYDELSKSIRAMEEAKAVAKEAILAKMRETGNNLEALEAGGYKASISYREYVGFNRLGPDGESMPHEAFEQRLKDLRAFMWKHAPALDIPSTEGLGKAYEAYLAQFDNLGDNSPPPLPAFLKKSTTPVLRVSGRAAK